MGEGGREGLRHGWGVGRCWAGRKVCGVVAIRFHTSRAAYGRDVVPPGEARVRVWSQCRLVTRDGAGGVAPPASSGSERGRRACVPGMVPPLAVRIRAPVATSHCRQLYIATHCDYVAVTM